MESGSKDQDLDSYHWSFAEMFFLNFHIPHCSCQPSSEEYQMEWKSCPSCSNCIKCVLNSPEGDACLCVSVCIGEGKQLTEYLCRKQTLKCHLIFKVNSSLFRKPMCGSCINNDAGTSSLSVNASGNSTKLNSLEAEHNVRMIGVGSKYIIMH